MILQIINQFYKFIESLNALWGYFAFVWGISMFLLEKRIRQVKKLKEQNRELMKERVLYRKGEKYSQNKIVEKLK